MTEEPVLPSLPVWPHVVTDPEGIGVDDLWSSSTEGDTHGITLSTIHLDTVRIGVGPPLHQHPYTELIKVLRGRAVFTIGTEEMTLETGQTAIIPPRTPHTFRTEGSERYESFAMHLSAAFVTENLEEQGAW